MRTKKRTAGLCAGVVALAVGVFAAPAGAERGQTVEEIIGILKDKGLIDEEQQQRLLMKHSAEGESNPPVGSDWILAGWDFYGDFRLRHELFTYRSDTNGDHRDSRYRFRYRGRIGFEKQLADSLAVGMRFATGGSPSTSDHRATNQSLGSGNDFDFDSIRIDRAYVQWQPREIGGLKTLFAGSKDGRTLMLVPSNLEKLFQGLATTAASTLRRGGRSHRQPRGVGPRSPAGAAAGNPRPEDHHRGAVDPRPQPHRGRRDHRGGIEVRSLRPSPCGPRRRRGAGRGPDRGALLPV